MAITQDEAAATDVVDELAAWLESNWDPDLSVEEWWERLGLSGWAAPSLPENAYGKGLSRGDAVRVQQTITRFGALGAPAGLGVALAAPTIATHGTQEQIDLYVREIVTGQKAWCQLFSEPGAGSDLAGLTTRAVADGDEWIVTGQKVWTSSGQIADLGMLLARTDFDVPKHQGITWFAIDMHQPGVEVRPLKEMTGRALFNEVFLSEARVPNDAIVGGPNKGWAVGNTTLMFERGALGAGGGEGTAGGAMPGTIAGNLQKRAGELVPKGSDAGRRARSGVLSGSAKLLIEVGKTNDSLKDPLVRQDIAHLHTLGELGRFNNLRLKAAKGAGKDIPGIPNISKLVMSNIVRLSRDLGLRMLGPLGMLHAYDNAGRKALDAVTANPYLAAVTEMALFAQGPPIYGGTDQIQRNIIGERVLGLPKEPNDDKTRPFSDLPKNA